MLQICLGPANSQLHFCREMENFYLYVAAVHFSDHQRDQNGQFIGLWATF